MKRLASLVVTLTLVLVAPAAVLAQDGVASVNAAIAPEKVAELLQRCQAGVVT